MTAAGAALFAATIAAQQNQFPSTPPAPGQPKGFSLPETKKFTLENGLQVTLVPYGTVPKVDIVLAVDSGNAYEHANEVWLADLLGELMMEGTKTRSATEVSEQAAQMGGSVTVAVGADTATVAADALAENAAAMAALVADVAMNPALPDAELARLKADLLRNLSIGQSQPQQIALEKFRATMYVDHSYGRVFPTAEMIKGYTLPQAQEYYARTFGPARARLYIAGMFDSAAVEAAVRTAFASWKGAPDATAAKPNPFSARGIYIVDRPGAPQTTILLGMPTIDPSHPDYVAMVVTNSLLGGAFMSRITKNIREDKGYTYSPFSQISSRYRDAYWAQNADVTTADTGASLKEIFSEIDRLQAEPPPAEELEGIKNYVAGSFVLQNSARAGIIGQLALLDLHGLPSSYLTEYVQKVHAVTPAKVQEMAQKYIADDKAIIVLVGDRKIIEEQVKPFGEIR
jgi:predicted Zn-dependent peptidase